MSNFDILFEKILVKEGGYSDSPSDYGNYCAGSLTGTKYGVSSVAYREYYGRCPSKSEMMNLTIPEAKAIWKRVVWDKIKGDSIKNISIAELMLDSAGGGANGYLHIRQAINTASGSKVVSENKTMLISNAEAQEINKIPERKYFDTLYQIRLNYFNNHPQKDIYSAGWINRLNSVYGSFVYYYKSNSKKINYVLVGVGLLAVSGYLYLLKRKGFFNR